jgi:hypothetical protein
MLFCCFANSVFASSSLTSVLDQANLEQAKLLYDEVDEQLNVLVEQVEAITGETTYGDLINDELDKLQRQWDYDLVDEFNDMVEAGYNPGDINDRMKYYAELYPEADLDDINPGDPNSIHRTYYEHSSGWTGHNMMMAGKIISEVNEHVAEIEELIEASNETDSLKESTDLGNRIAGEVALLSRLIVQVQSMVLQMVALEQQYTLNAVKDNSDFFKDFNP